MFITKRLIPALLAFLLAIACLSGCDAFHLEGHNPSADTESTSVSSISIVNGGRLSIGIGETIQLKLNISEDNLDDVRWNASNGNVSVSPSGLVTGIASGKVSITVSLGNLRDTVLFEVIEVDGSMGDPYESISAEDFYASYEPADSYTDAYYRTKHGLMSGELTVPDQSPVLSEYQPMVGNAYVRNNEPYYVDQNTYVIVDAYGQEIMRIYRGGGYITLEEVAAYVLAFGDVPANYVSDKKTEPEDSIWGEYLRLNHSSFSGSTSKYPYEPELPNISGCGGELYYYEIDIGTTGTDCDPKYRAAPYNNGQSITRGAARIVYTRYDKNKNEIIEPNEKFVFYTYNHYNDFQEYLNYYGGWGEIFGNVTGGGKISSKTEYNPTSYVPVIMASLRKAEAAEFFGERSNPIELVFILPTFKYAR